MKTTGLSMIAVLALLRIGALAEAQTIRFAVIGDYGEPDNPAEKAVADLVKGWSPQFIITTGDNDYTNATRIDEAIGQYYHGYIYNYQGSYGAGSATGRFFPSWGNHEYYNNTGSLAPYLDWFDLPGNERYYKFSQGPVDFFALNGNGDEVDGVTSNSTQAQWLRQALAESTASWKVVYLHQPPYSSGIVHGSEENMRWPFEQWGADMVLGGHEHHYERLLVGEVPYLVNGSGGCSLYRTFTNPPLAQSRVRFGSEYGAMRVEADSASIRSQFITTAGTLVDDFLLVAGAVRLDKEGGSPTASKLSAQVRPGGWLDLDATQHLVRLDVGGQVNAMAGLRLLVSRQLSIAASGQLDLADKAMVLKPAAGDVQAALEQVWGWIAQGRAGGNWSGDGIMSSTAAAQALPLKGLAAILNAGASGAPIHLTFEGEPVNASSILVMYTYNGDADVDGIIDFNDYFQIDHGFASGLTGYRNGDFDYNGRVNADDYYLIDLAFLRQAPAGKAAVPEPGRTLWLAAMAGALVARPRSRLPGQSKSPFNRSSPK